MNFIVDKSILSLKILTKEQQEERRQSWDRLFAKYELTNSDDECKVEDGLINNKTLRSRKRKKTQVRMPEIKNIAKTKSPCKTILKFHPSSSRSYSNTNECIVNDIDNISTSKSSSIICSKCKCTEYEVKDEIKDEFTPGSYADNHCIKILKRGGKRQINAVNTELKENMKIETEDEVISKKQELSNNNQNVNGIRNADELNVEFTPNPNSNIHCGKEFPKQGGRRQMNSKNRESSRQRNKKENKGGKRQINAVNTELNKENMKIETEDKVISKKQELPNNNLSVNDIRNADELNVEFTPNPYSNIHCGKEFPKQGGQRQMNSRNRESSRQRNKKENKEININNENIKNVVNNPLRRNRVQNIDNKVDIKKQRVCKKKLNLQNDSENNSRKTAPKKQKQLKVKPNQIYLIHSSCKKEIVGYCPELVENSLSKNTPLKTNPLKAKSFNKDQDESEIKNLIENKLKSDLAYKVFKRYYSQLNTDKESFLYWDDAVKDELQKLSNISLDKLSQYMLSSLTQKIIEFNNETMASRNSPGENGNS